MTSLQCQNSVITGAFNNQNSLLKFVLASFLRLLSKIRTIIRYYDTIEEINVDSKAEYTA